MEEIQGMVTLSLLESWSESIIRIVYEAVDNAS